MYVQRYNNMAPAQGKGYGKGYGKGAYRVPPAPAPVYGKGKGKGKGLVYTGKRVATPNNYHVKPMVTTAPSAYRAVDTTVPMSRPQTGGAGLNAAYALGPLSVPQTADAALNASYVRGRDIIAGGAAHGRNYTPASMQVPVPVIDKNLADLMMRGSNYTSNFPSMGEVYPTSGNVYKTTLPTSVRSKSEAPSQASGGIHSQSTATSFLNRQPTSYNVPTFQSGKKGPTFKGANFQSEGVAKHNDKRCSAWYEDNDGVCDAPSAIMRDEAMSGVSFQMTYNNSGNVIGGCDPRFGNAATAPHHVGLPNDRFGQVVAKKEVGEHEYNQSTLMPPPMPPQLADPEYGPSCEQKAFDECTGTYRSRSAAPRGADSVVSRMTSCKAKAPEYSMNEVVILKNLENRPDINGFRGKVVHVGEYGFYQIEIMVGSDRELLCVGAENLEKFGFDHMPLPNQESFGFKAPCFGGAVHHTYAAPAMDTTRGRPGPSDNGSEVSETPSEKSFLRKMVWKKDQKEQQSLPSVQEQSAEQKTCVPEELRHLYSKNTDTIMMNRGFSQEPAGSSGIARRRTPTPENRSNVLREHSTPENREEFDHQLSLLKEQKWSVDDRVRHACQNTAQPMQQQQQQQTYNFAPPKEDRHPRVAPPMQIQPMPQQQPAQRQNGMTRQQEPFADFPTETANVEDQKPGKMKRLWRAVTFRKPQDDQNPSLNDVNSSPIGSQAYGAPVFQGGYVQEVSTQRQQTV